MFHLCHRNSRWDRDPHTTAAQEHRHALPPRALETQHQPAHAAQGHGDEGTVLESRQVQGLAGPSEAPPAQAGRQVVGFIPVLQRPQPPVSDGGGQTWGGMLLLTIAPAGTMFGVNNIRFVNCILSFN